MTSKNIILTSEDIKQFETEGFVIVKGLFSEEDLVEIDQTFEEISNQIIPGYFTPDLNPENTDPLKRYPRVMHPHRFNETAKRFMLHKPVLNVLSELFNEEALAAQSMFYYKPPGARGQALHQDNFYLKVEPGNCIAAWTAMDQTDQENGGLLVVPKTSNYELVCPESSDSKESFTTHYVKPPKDRKPIPAIMDRGDVLFFNGNLIHGSYRNKTKNRFRRSFICHYANSSATSIGSPYRPLFRADGSEVDMDANPDGGPCGIEYDSPYIH
ncbi:phytanoyl-CoA dioxygenase family protein [Alkalicoccobacillus murimartini]|uniref:Ectoine hydroxylase-related dioxygenase (Phytanoyl-CoA dioxygenase family) n=1 Tax=Alkalicoccobacillus murimartini TaxID=171685 RepID=A0ABT9YII9_9BACI|nr:phytanoyl-CoA dioxygenase family protein [Alkalicoccobacillus murimartini]MDQ0207521.1 ectoine hydroxylase-related dioxygenase (phytanoyl-CoA dioxygenase family) [Alkalicoccobacillus murimartini]